MAIYIISDDSRFAIRASNIVSAAGGTAVISESDARSHQIQTELKSAIQNYDFVLVLSESSAKASIEANKVEGVRAYSCSSAADFDEAREAEANVIVVSLSRFQGEHSAVSEIISAMLESQPKPRRRARFQMPQLPQIQSPIEPKEHKGYKEYKDYKEDKPKPKKDRKPVIDTILNKFEAVALPKDYKEDKPERKPDNPKEKKKGLRGLKEKLGVE